MKQHSVQGCDKCSAFLAKFLPHNPKFRVSKSVGTELKESIKELFAAMKMDSVLIENELKVTVTSFAKDFLKMTDEVKTENDIVRLWHIDTFVAKKLFDLFNEVVFGVLDYSSNSSGDSESDSDNLDESTDEE